jgi:hypothetical protein
MKIAGIAIDAWKLPVFERRLRDSGFTFRNRGPLLIGTLLLQVEVEDGRAQALAQLVLAANNEATSARRHGGMHGFKADCKGCAARAASRSWATWEARGAGRQSSLYLELLDAHGVTHAEVKAAAASDALAKVGV